MYLASPRVLDTMGLEGSIVDGRDDWRVYRSVEKI